MVQQLRAHRHVDASVGDRESQRIPHSRGIQAHARRPRDRFSEVDTEDGERDAGTPRLVTRMDRDVREPGADVEKRRAPRQLRQEGTQRLHRGSRTSEQDVRAGDIRHRSRAHIGRRRGIIEDLDAASSRRRQASAHQRSSWVYPPR